LIANDDEMQLTVLQMMFTHLKFSIVTAMNGYEAYLEVQASLKKRVFDLVILDLNMPISDGWDALKKIKGLYSNPTLFLNQDDSKTRQEPIIIAVSGEVD
jgi:CheY-like chemotaxis protein